MSDRSTLYICSTPIGNLGDISKRLESVLTTVDDVFAEDTRVTAKLLNHVRSKANLHRLDENIMQNHADKVINMVGSGHSVAYCSDAGVPGVSDPGISLISLAREAGIKCEVLPGPCAAINAYVASGFNNSKFYFGGFFPRKTNDITKTLENLSSLNAVLIFYESPKRLVKTLRVLSDFDDNLKLSVCRELTKVHEEIVVGFSKQVYEEFSLRDEVRGECVICINNTCSQVSDGQAQNTQIAVRKLIENLLNEGMRSKMAAKIASSTFDISKNEAYNIALELSK